MKNMRLPETLQQKVSDHLIYTEESLASQKEFMILQQRISPSLNNQVMRSLFDTIIQFNGLLTNQPMLTEFIIQRLQPEFCKPEQSIIRQGDLMDSRQLYFVARGDVEVTVVDENGTEFRVAILTPGEHFGEIALFSNSARTASVNALKYCTLAVLSYSDFKHMLGSFSNCIEIFKQRMFTYKDAHKKFLLRMIKHIPVFRQLKRRTKQEILYSMSLKSYEEQEYIIKPGMVLEEILLLSEGLVEVSYTCNDKRQLRRKNLRFHLTNESIFSRQRHWNLNESKIDINAKKHTEMFPIMGATGIEDAVHATELTAEHKKNWLGQYCIEFILQILGKGSVFGAFSVPTSEVLTIQVKALEKCTFYVIKKSQLQQLRIAFPDLNESLSKLEKWSRHYPPLVDDYLEGDSLLDIKKIFRRRFRSLILRIIQENRERRLLAKPLIAQMIEKLAGQKQSIKGKHSIAQKVLRMTFNPKRNQTDESNNLKQLIKEVSDIKTMISENYEGLTSVLSYLEANAGKSQARLSDNKDALSTSTVQIQTDDQPQYHYSTKLNTALRPFPSLFIIKGPKRYSNINYTQIIGSTYI